MAAPNPEKELQRLAKILAAKQRPPVLALQGPAQWFKGRAIDGIRGLGGDLTELDGQDGAASGQDAAAFLMDLRTASLFGGHRTLLLRNAERWLKSHGKALADVVEKIAPGNLLVLVANKLDGRSALVKRIKKIGEVFEFRQLYEKAFEGRPATSSEVVQWLVARAKTHGLQLDAGAALFWVDLVGGDPGTLDGEVERLQPLLAGSRVTPERLRGVLEVRFGSTQFELVDAIVGADAKLALRSLRGLQREGLRDRDGKPIEKSATFPIVSSWLMQTLQKLLEARIELDAGAPRGAVVAQYGGYFKDRFARQLDRRSRAELVALLAALRRAERRLRLSGEDGNLLLERLVFESLLPIRRELLGSTSEVW